MEKYTLEMWVREQLTSTQAERVNETTVLLTAKIVRIQ